MSCSIVVPTLTLGAFEPTVLNCFLFRQTDLVLSGAVRKRTAPLYLDQQRRTRKMKAFLIDFQRFPS